MIKLKNIKMKPKLIGTFLLIGLIPLIGVGLFYSHGYFRQQLDVYDREGLPCRECKVPVSAIVLGQRSSYYCKSCQH